MKINLSATRVALLTSLLSITFWFSYCAEKEGFSPSEAPLISGISANNGGALYCSISGGCTLSITGSNFSETSVVYVGPYRCNNQVLNTEKTQIDCVVAPAQNGVYDIIVKNGGVQPSKLDPSITDPNANKFSYASFLYLGSQETPGKVYGYAQNPTTGALIPITGSPFSISGNNGTYGTVIHPNNRFLYAANVSSNTVSVYSINPQTGGLTAVGTPTNSGSTMPNGLFFHPSGNYLFVTHYSGNRIAAFSVASDGTLTAVPGSPFATTGATIINGVVVTSDGKFLYAASMGGNGGVVGFTIDQDTGALTLIPGSPFRNTLGGDTTNPGDGITIHPNGHWLYMGLVGLRKMTAWSIDATTGVLTPIEAPILNNSTTGYVDNGGSASTVSKDGRFLYGTAFSTNGTDPKKIIVYAIDQITGGLTRVSEADTGGGPNDVRLDTNGAYAYTCNSVNPPSVSAFSVNAETGALTALSPRDYGIAAPSYGPGIMVMQRNLAETPTE